MTKGSKEKGTANQQAKGFNGDVQGPKF